MSRTAPASYSLVQIALHWLIAALVLFQLLFGESMTTVVDAAEEGNVVGATDQSLATAHYWVGIAILSFAVLRLIVRLTRGAPAPAAASKPMVLASTAAHWLFYALLFAVPTTGLLAYYGFEGLGDIHSLGKPVFIVLIVVHAAAALFHQFFLKDGTLMRMFSTKAA